MNQGFEKEETEDKGKMKTKQGRSISRPKKAELGLKGQ